MTAQWVWLAGFLFFATHLGVSSTGLRPLLIAQFGQGAYLGIYSGMAFATLAALVWTYTGTPHFPLSWPALTLAPKLIMPFAVFFIVGGFTVPNPTSVGAETRMAGDAARGLLRITRHPVQWGLLLWATSHLLANSDIASIGFFGSMAAVSALGMLAMDRRKAGLEQWPAFAAVTSVIPFGAIVGGRNRLVAAELLLPLAIASIVTLTMWWFHPALSGGVALL